MPIKAVGILSLIITSKRLCPPYFESHFPRGTSYWLEESFVLVRHRLADSADRGANLALDECISQIAVDEAHSGIITQKVRNLRRRAVLGRPKADVHSADFFHGRSIDRAAAEEVATCGFIGRIFRRYCFAISTNATARKKLSRRQSPSKCD